MSTAVVPGGCMKYIQAPDVWWDKPLKEHLSKQYDNWLTNDDNKHFAKGGKLKASALPALVEWVKTARSLLSIDLITA
jgi:hypothetical protein